MRIKSSERFGEREATVGKEHREKKKFEKGKKSGLALQRPHQKKKKRFKCKEANKSLKELLVQKKKKRMKEVLLER